MGYTRNVLFKDNQITLTNNLANVHLTLAFEALLSARERKNFNQFPVSVLLHGFCALESAINFIAHEHFSNTASDFYISADKRDFALRRLIQQWNYSVPVMEKFIYLLEMHKLVILRQLELELKEFNLLRNYIAHGFTYQTTYIVTPNEHEENSWQVLDTSNNIDWARKFPATGFNSLYELKYADGYLALRIITDALQQLAKHFHQTYSVTIIKKTIKHALIYSQPVTLDKLLEQLMEE